MNIGYFYYTFDVNSGEAIFVMILISVIMIVLGLVMVGKARRKKDEG